MSLPMQIIDRPSPNQDERGANEPIEMLILHYTGMVSGEAALQRLTDAEAKVSAHYTIDVDGLVYRHVHEERRAWHAGVSSWRGYEQVNGRSIGIEIVNPGHEFGYVDFPNEQMQSVLSLSCEVVGRHKIEKRNVVAHSDVAPSRKTDPGEKFDWESLAAQGVGMWVHSNEISIDRDFEIPTRASDVAAMQKKLADFGYGLESNGHLDGQTTEVIIAFQRHFRQSNIDGVFDAETSAILDALIRSID